MSEVREAVARPTRTALQLSAGAAVVELVDAFGAGFDGRQYAALVVALGLVFGFLQTVAENRAGWAFLRYVEPTTVPVLDEAEPDPPQARRV